MKQPRRRKRPEHSWDRLRGTRLEVVPLDAGTVRRVCVNVDDPLAAVVSFGVHALTHDANEGHTLRLLAVDNFNADPRELHQIPEAREWFRRLWHEGKPLLRVLSECAGDMPADDRLGLSERDVSQLGLGWFDCYVLGMCEIDATLSTHPDGGPWYQLAATGDHTREEIRAELLQMSPANPEGYTFDDAANRSVFTANNMEGALKASRTMGRDRDAVVLVLSLLDTMAAKLANGIADPEEIRRTMADCRARDLHPGAVVGVPRTLAVEAVREFAPGAAERMEAGPPQNGWHWGVFVAFNGTTLAVLNPPAMEATT